MVKQIASTFILLMIFFAIGSNSAHLLKNRLKAEIKDDPSNTVGLAVAYLFCKGESDCITKNANACPELKNLDVKVFEDLEKNFAITLNLKNDEDIVKGMMKYSQQFTTYGKPIISCKITPKELKDKMTKGARYAEKAAKKAIEHALASGKDQNEANLAGNKAGEEAIQSLLKLAKTSGKNISDVNYIRLANLLTELAEFTG